MNQGNELTSHIRDLADRCFNRETAMFSDFLSMAEQSEILYIQKEISYVDFTWFGGMEGCERRMLMLSPHNKISCQLKNSANNKKNGKSSGEYDSNNESNAEVFCSRQPEIPDEVECKDACDMFPIKCLIVEPLIQKFADSLTHRDFLGSLMNLGINREVIGDIIVRENRGFIFCEEKMAGFICENFARVKHTSVKCLVAEDCPDSAKPVLKEEKHIVQSERCDGVISKVYNLSRNQSIELFRTNNVYVDGRQCENNSALLKEGMTVSVRGYGKFIFDGEAKETRKGKCWISIRKYV